MTTECKRAIVKVISAVSAAISLAAFAMWVPALLAGSGESFCLMGASIIFPHGNLKTQAVRRPTPSKISSDKDIFCELVNFTNKPSSTPHESPNDDSILEILESVPPFELPDQPSGPKNKVVECAFGASGVKFENIYINNQTNVAIDVASKLRERPDINPQSDGSPQVLLVHTHTTEAYMDKSQGFYYRNFSARTRDNRYNVVQVGDAICKSLEHSGIKCIHDTTCHDDPAYTGSYKRAEETISKNLKKHPSIQVVLDIHRDTIENGRSHKIKPTFTHNGIKGAQIMIISGCDATGKLEHPDWQYNLTFALRLQKQVETMYPGMTRALLFKEARYNQHKTHGSLLIEVGSDVNTLNEAVYSGALLGKALGAVLNDL